MPSQKEILYEGLKTDLLAVRYTRTDTGKEIRFSKVELWRNNLEREKKEQPFKHVACFIEFMPSNYMELSNGLQSYDLTCRLHIVFESYKDEDLEILGLVDAVYRKVQLKQYGFLAKMKRRNEEQNFDHDNIQDYMQDYDCGKAKDFPTQTLVPATLTDVDVTPDIKIIT